MFMYSIKLSLGLLVHYHIWVPLVYIPGLLSFSQYHDFYWVYYQNCGTDEADVRKKEKF